MRSATVVAAPTALLSVYDKSGVVEFATACTTWAGRSSRAEEPRSTIAATGVPVTNVADLTGFPAILGHRVVTLHPEGARRHARRPRRRAHRADLTAYGIEPISLVVVNLYPFSSDPGIELIDIGGPTSCGPRPRITPTSAWWSTRREYEPVVAEIGSTAA